MGVLKIPNWFRATSGGNFCDGVWSGRVCAWSHHRSRCRSQIGSRNRSSLWRCRSICERGGRVSGVKSLDQDKFDGDIPGTRATHSCYTLQAAVVASAGIDWSARAIFGASGIRVGIWRGIGIRWIRLAHNYWSRSCVRFIETLAWRGNIRVCGWWALEFACTAPVLDFSTVTFPGCAAAVTCGTGRIVACVELIIAALRSLRIVSGYYSILFHLHRTSTYLPAASFVCRRWKLSTTPVAIADETIWWLKTFRLCWGVCANLEIALASGSASIGCCTKPLKGLKLVLPDVIGHGRVFEADISRNRDGVPRFSCSIGSEEYLRASDIELRVRRAFICLMQCQQGWTHEVVATREIVGNCDRQMAFVSDEFFGAPFLVCWIVVIAVNTEPAVSNSLVLDGRVDFLHVDFARSFMADIDGARLRAIRPITILKGNFRTGLSTTDSGDTFLAVDA